MSATMRVLTAGATIAALACGSRDTTAPVHTALGASGAARDSSGSPPPNPPTTPPDTGRTLPTRFDVLGRVLGVTVRGGRDSLAFTPIPGATVKLVRNILVNGAAQQVSAGSVVTDSNGQWRFSDLPGGYYIATAVPPAGTPWREASEYVPGVQPRVAIDIYVWK